MRPPLIYPFPVSGTTGMDIGILVSMAIDIYYKEKMSSDMQRRLDENKKAIDDMAKRLLRP